MGMATTLFDDAEQFEQFDNTPLTEGRIWNLVKIGSCFREEDIDYENLYMYIVQEQGQITPGNKILIVTKRVYYFDHTF